jgi:Na+(H+)/acetate symporter ActP
MIATTWVQIVKAVLLLGGTFLLAMLLLSRFDFNPAALFGAAAQKYGDGVLVPGQLVSNPWDAISLGMALMFGTVGLPHILMRFYTVPDARAARTSVFYATGLIGFFYLMTLVLGFGAMVLVGPDTIRAVDPGATWLRRSSPSSWEARLSWDSSRQSPSRRFSRSSPDSRSPARLRCHTTSGSTSSGRAPRVDRRNSG